MSSYGTAFVLDQPGTTAAPVPDEVKSELESGFTTLAPDGWRRTVAYLGGFDMAEALLGWLADAEQGRIVIAEDNDEYGARWVVAKVDDGAVTVVHQRYVLNADPDDPDEVETAVEDLERDPRPNERAGSAAAVAAATLFGSPAEAMVAAEEGSASAWKQIGVVGGPFPWWNAMGLPWPVPQAGEPLTW